MIAKEVLFTIIFLFMVLFNMISAYGQDDLRPNDQTFQITDLSDISGLSTYRQEIRNYKGSPLLKDTFEQGWLIFNSGKKSETLLINYDIHQNQLLLRRNDQNYIINKNLVTAFVFNPLERSINSTLAEYFSLTLRDKVFEFTEPTPVQVLYDQGSGLKLFALHEVTLRLGNQKDMFTGKIINEFNKKTKHYIQMQNGDLKEINKLRINHIKRLFDSQTRSKIESFVNENNLSNRSKKDVVKLMSFIDNYLTTFH